MKTAYKFQLYPNRQQEAQLALTRETCRHLWNKALAEKQYNPYLNAYPLGWVGSYR